MTRPDSGSPDQGANQDDAVWLDLVARLEGTPSGPEAPAANTGSDAEHPAGPPAPAGTATAGTGASFRDFDPLGLASAAPTELSAAERSAVAGPEAPDTADETAPGPRDFSVDDADGHFVPEDPPSLAGTDPLTMLAWLGAVGGPVALVLSAMFWRSAPLLAILGIVAVFILSVVYLIMKLPQEKDENDDGARV
ncbi:MAG: hypothetical protein JWQ75_1966 [Pseudarthrobacter sp.]|nr:hypothetical protein [Pseudarthrobacter sp.]